jgi:hypothetical protein
LRIRAVRAIRSALLARLPLLVGLCRLDFLVAALVFVDLLPAVFVLLDAEVAFLLDVACRTAGFLSSADWPVTGNALIRTARIAATHRIACQTTGCWREMDLIMSLYL